MSFVIAPLSPAHISAWGELFEAAASTCFCRYWHFEGDKNAWLARSAFEPEISRAEHAACVERGDDDGKGLVALEGALCVGWLKLTPRASVPKLRRLPVYKKLDLGEEAGAWSIGCLLVRPDRRGEGVSRALIAEAGAHARAWGATSLEAYPHVQDTRTSDEQMWRGTLSAYLAAGFVEVAGERPYPVLRLAL